jgi:long-subunit acyl-CoA synthetase (AMP-forming)
VSSSINDLYQSLTEHPERRMRFMSVAGKLVTRNFPQIHEDVLELMAELRESGIEPGDLVGVTGPNSYEWVLADLALLGLGSIPVALPLEQLTGAAAVDELAGKYGLSAVLTTQPLASDSGLPDGVAVLGERPLKLVRRSVPVGGRQPLSGDVFTIAFSSGTSGSKKGLLMSAKGVENTMRTSAEAWRLTAEDDLLIVMPFSNFQQRYLLYTAVRYGTDVTVVAPERMFQKLREFEPTIVLGPPSFFELAANRVGSAGLRERLPYLLATALHTLAPGRLSRGLRSRLGRKWLDMYGSRVRLMLTGSAPVPPRTVRLFQRLGAPLFEVYGSTEIGWIAFNLPGRHRTGSAGRPVDRIGVDVADDGEVTVRTRYPQCLGYVFEGVETQEAVFLGDDRIATGDLGEFDRAGFLWLKGRKKNVIITRSGVKINPEELELGLEKACPGARAMVASPDGDGLLTCVVWLDDEQSVEHLAQVEAYLDETNKKRESAFRISETVFRPAAELTVEEGLLTRNFKIDRSAVMRRVFAERTGVGR